MYRGGEIVRQLLDIPLHIPYMCIQKPRYGACTCTYYEYYMYCIYMYIVYTFHTCVYRNLDMVHVHTCIHVHKHVYIICICYYDVY